MTKKDDTTIPDELAMDSPSGEGYYWYQASQSAQPEVVKVQKIGTGLIKWYYYRIGQNEPEVLRPGQGRWAYCHPRCT